MSLQRVLVFALFVSVFWASSGQLADATSNGPRNPSVFENDASIGTVAWTGSADTLVSDDQRAEAFLLPNGVTNFLKLSNFRFSIPSTATIKGIKVEVEHSATAIGSVTDNAVRIVKNSNIGILDRSNSSAWPSSDAYQSYGGSSDLWGETWTPEDINSELFGVAISAKAAAGATVYIDHIRITVYYEDIHPPTLTIFSDSPDPAGIGATVTFGVHWVDLNIGEGVKAHVCKTNAIIPSASGGSCEGGSLATASSITTANPVNLFYTVQASDISPILYYVFVCDASSLCSAVSGNGGSITIQQPGGTLPPSPPVIIQPPSSSPVTVNVQLSSGTSTSATSTASLSASLGEGKILNKETTVHASTTFTILFKTASGLKGADRPVLHVYDENFNEKIANQPLEEAGKSGIYKANIVFDPKWGTGDFFVSVSEPKTDTGDNLILTIAPQRVATTSETATTLPSATVPTFRSPKIPANVATLLTKIATLRMPKELTVADTAMLLGVAAELKSGLREERVSDLATFIPQTEERIRSVKTIQDEREKRKTVRNAMQEIKAFGQITATFFENEKEPAFVTFLTEGSIILNILVTNPHDSQEESVHITVPLPRGATPQHVLKMPEELSVQQGENDAYVLSGTVAVARGDARKFEIELEDIWLIPETEFAALVEQAERAYAGLSGTPVAAEGLLLKDKILQRISDVRARQEFVETTDQRIAQHPENVLTLESIRGDIQDLTGLAERRKRNMWLGWGGVVLFALIVLALFLALWRRFGSAMESLANRGQSFSFVSHQLRSPLAVIRWSLERLRSLPGLSPTQEKYLQNAVHASEQSSQMTQDLLTVAKLESETTAIEKRPVNLQEILRDVLEEIKPIVAEKKLRVNERYDEDIRRDPF